MKHPGSRSKVHSTKSFRIIRRIAEAYGYSFDGTNHRGHFKWVHPTKIPVVTISKESCTRSLKNVERTFKTTPLRRTLQQLYLTQGHSDVA